MQKPRIAPTPAAPDPLVEAFLEKIDASIADGSLVRLVLSSPTSSGPDHPLRLQGRLVDLRGRTHLSITTQFPQRDDTRNLTLSEVRAALASSVYSAFRSGLLETTVRDWQLHRPAQGPARLRGHRPRTMEVPGRKHDHAKASVLDDGAAAWLQALGIAGNDGRARASMAAKHQQVRRYTEILGHLVRDAAWAPGSKVRLVDMGCGKGYLTFGAWHLLRSLELEPEVTGIEVRPDLVESANQVVQHLQLPGLRFELGQIESAPIPAADILVALHACNTATDDAIRRGIDLGARLVLVAPCCHQELRPQLGSPAPLAPIFEHGLMQERFAEWLTDGLRALFLQWAGYETRAIEFVSPEHTARNLLLAGLRRHAPFSQPGLRQQILDVKSFFKIGPLALDSLLDRTGPGQP